MLTEQIKTQIKELAESDKESCGLIVNGDAIALRNVHPEPEDNFRLDAIAFSKYKREDIDCIWHTHWKDSHPGELTACDLAIAHKSDKFPLLLYHTGFNCWDYYEPDNPNPYPLDEKWSQLDYKLPNSYINWRFVWGRTDCFGLVRRFFLGVKGINIGEFTRPSVDNFPTPNFISSWKSDENGFVKLPKDTPPANFDVFEIAINGGQNPNHIAVIINAQENQILHSPAEGHFSRLIPYGTYYRSRTTGHFRHKSLF